MDEIVWRAFRLAVKLLENLFGQYVVTLMPRTYIGASWLRSILEKLEMFALGFNDFERAVFKTDIFYGREEHELTTLDV